MLYVPERRIIGGRLPQDSATSEIESRELLYHSWRTPKNCVPFLQHPAKKRSRNYWLGSPFVAPVRSVRLVLVRRPLAARACVRLVRRTARDIGRLWSP